VTRPPGRSRRTDRTTTCRVRSPRPVAQVHVVVTITAAPRPARDRQVRDLQQARSPSPPSLFRREPRPARRKSLAPRPRRRTPRAGSERRTPAASGRRAIVPVERLDDAFTSTFDRVGHGQRRHDTVPTRRAQQHALNDAVVDQGTRASWTSTRTPLGTAASASWTESARVAPRSAGATLLQPSSRRAESKLLPVGGRGDDDRVHPVPMVQAPEAFSEQGPVAQANEALGRSAPSLSPLPAAARTAQTLTRAGARLRLRLASSRRTWRRFLRAVGFAVLRATAFTVFDATFELRVGLLTAVGASSVRLELTRTPSSHSAASSSSMSFAYMSSLAGSSWP